MQAFDRKQRGRQISEFQASQGYVRPCQKVKKKGKGKKGRKEKKKP